ncbi:MAG: glycoside hydrolase family 130 protein [Lentisphaeria bacterium]|nr:glycoside hydrolase family 130 protein [Lentisphaeria bacterium]
MAVGGFSFVQRCGSNPILSKEDVPYPAELVFNAGVCKFQNKYVMCFRNDYGCTREEFVSGKGHFQTNIGLAFSDDGLHWEVAPQPVFEYHDSGCRRAYDPRLTVLDGRCYLCFAADGDCGVCGGIAVTDDFEKFEVLCLSEPDNRNMVLFPERINGEFLRLDRPMPVYGKNGEFFDLWLSRSPDCRHWGDHKRLLRAEDIPFCNSKCGPAAPPVKTKAGWLTTFHAVEKLGENALKSWDPAGWSKLYTAGIMLLDPDDPGKVLGLAKTPMLAPVMDYENDGFRGGAIFPGGMILEDSGEVKIYYGAADTVECLATADVEDLVAACLGKFD